MPLARRSECAPSSTSGGYGAFTTTFEDLYGMNQLPGLACQRLMAEGYGFGAEGDWKTAALVRLDEGHLRGSAGRRVVHGGLHVPPGQRRGASPRGAHARGLSALPIARRQALARGPSARHRRQGRSLPSGLQCGARTGGRRDTRRHGRTDAPDRPRGGRRQSRARHAEAPGGAGALGPAPGFQAWRCRRGSSQAARITRRSARP